MTHREKRAPSDRAVCLVQHAAAEPPGLIGDVLRSEGWRFQLVRTYRNERVPVELGSLRGLIILGGPMSVYDAADHPWLDAEKTLIEDALARRLPVLGICLGSQLLAAALGATVIPSVRREIGWHQVHFTRAAREDPLFGGLDATLTAFHWHGERFELPKQAVSLAWSDMTDCQAFRWGPSAYGVLFHMEMDGRGVARMTRAFQAELLSTGQRPDEIVDAGVRHGPGLERFGRSFFSRWTRLLKD